MAVSDRFVCAVCGYIEHAECYLPTHPYDTICRKCGAESCNIIFLYVNFLNFQRLDRKYLFLDEYNNI